MTINEVIISGRLTRDPEIRSTQNGTKVATFAVALDRYIGEGKEPETDYPPVVAWGNLAEFCEKYLFKGKKVIIKGNLKTRTWTDSENKNHFVMEVWAEKIDFADEKKKDAEQGQGQPLQMPPPQNTAPSQDNRPPWLR